MSSRLGGYEVLGVLAESESRSLLRALDPQGRPVVLKVLAEQASAEDVARLAHELEVAGELSAEWVVRPRELTRMGRRHALVLEDSDGVSLASAIPPDGLKAPEFLGLAVGLTRAVAAVHAAGLIHRDLKPANIVVDAQSTRPRLTDFGLATRLARVNAEAGAERLEGTLAFLAPEQTGRMNRSVDQRSDLYALGVTLYQLATGRLPFEGGPLELIHAHLATQPTPAHEVNSGVPVGLSDVIGRLLAKAPEHRYQTADGLLADLEQASRACVDTGAVARFALGSADRPQRLMIPERLFGREPELAQLGEALADAAGGYKRLVLLRGPAGVGKTALVQEIASAVVAAGGKFAGRKFEQYATGYTPPTEILSAAVRHALAEPANKVALLRRRLLDMCGTNLGVLIELVPELELIVGPQPVPPTVGAAEAQRRLHAVLVAGAAAFGQPDSPMVMFVDDLQWAMAANLGLITAVMDAPEVTHQLFIGAYRPEEVSESHPLMTMLARIDPDRLLTIDVGRLDPSAAGELVAAAGAPQPELSAWLHELTGGNPFHLRQVLESLAADGLLRPVGAGWAADMRAVRAHVPSDDVVGFLADRLTELPEPTCHALRLAALVGARFDLETLATVIGRVPNDLAGDLWPAITAGLLITEDDRHELAGAGADPGQIRYRFRHDRVQQAAHALIPEADLAALHQLIGTRLRERLVVGDSQALFEVVGHLNAAAPLIQGGARSDLARLNKAAADRAKASSALDTALSLASAGLAAVTDPSDCACSLCFDLTLMQAQLLGLVGRSAEAETAFGRLLSRSLTELQAGAAWLALTDHLVAAGQMEQALAAARSGLTRFGVELPTGEDIPRETERLVGELLAPGVFDGLDSLGSADQSAEVVAGLLGGGVLAAYAARPEEFPLITAMAVQRLLHDGVTRDSALNLAWFANVAAAVGQLHAGIEIGCASLALSERAGGAASRSRSIVLAYVTVGYVLSIEEQGALMDEGYLACLSTGDFSYAGYYGWCGGPQRMLAGRDCVEHLAALERWCDSARQYTPFLVGHAAIRTDQMRRLMGVAREPLDTEQIVGDYEQLRDGMNSNESLFEIVRIDTMLGEYASAFRHALRAEPGRLAGGTSVGIWTFVFDVHLAIVCARLSTLTTDAGERAEHLQRLEDYLDRIRPFGELPLGVVAPHVRLVEAERERALGRFDAAVGAYLGAIDLAVEHRYTLLEGWGSELLGRLLLERGRPLGAAHLRAARECYLECGAGAKVAQLEAEFPEFAVAGAGTPAAPGVESVLAASGALAAQGGGEVGERLAAVAVEHAGAARAVWVPAGGDSPSARVDSALALPVTRNEVLLGWLCLEHDESGDFTPERVALLELLVPQMAVAVENAALYADLETKVADRRAELETTLAELKLTQDQIVQSEKLAALGGLVAGVAHEINNPVGVAVTAASHLVASTKEFTGAYAGGALRRSALDEFVRAASEGSALILTNLRRAAELVTGFKQVAVDQAVEERREFAVGAYLGDVVASLRPRLKGTGHRIEVDAPEEFVLEGYPGALAQVATNLVMNSLLHAYDEGAAGTLRFELAGEPGGIRLSFSDDGRGIPAELAPRVFEAFFTTRRDEGGSGLGLHIVHNLVTGRLGGTIALHSAPGAGARFEIRLPARAPGA